MSKNELATLRAKVPYFVVINERLGKAAFFNRKYQLVVSDYQKPVSQLKAVAEKYHTNKTDKFGLTEDAQQPRWMDEQGKSDSVGYNLWSDTSTGLYIQTVRRALERL